MQSGPTHQNDDNPTGPKSWLWFMGLWACGVTTVSLLGLGIKLVLG